MQQTKRSYILYADGVEEVEAVNTVDTLRRAGIDIISVATGENLAVTGATGQKLLADRLLQDTDFTEADWLIVPGGVPGAPNLHSDNRVNTVLKQHWDEGGRIASICAGPAIVLAPLGILKGKKATCYPGLEKALTDAGATYLKQPVVSDTNLITSEGPATTLLFAKAIIAATLGEKTADETLSSMLLD